jgi:hypothetical protein
MNALLSEFRLMDDAQLAEAIARLARTVGCMQGARGEIGARIRAQYQAALDAAQDEVEHRRI